MCVKEEEARVIVIVLACPRTVVFVEMEIVEARAIGVRSHGFPLPVTVCVATMPAEEQVALMVLAVMDLFPSELWATVVVPEAIFTEAFDPQVYCEEEEYALSRTVTLSMMTLQPILT